MFLDGCNTVGFSNLTLILTLTLTLSPTLLILLTLLTLLNPANPNGKNLRTYILYRGLPIAGRANGKVRCGYHAGSCHEYHHVRRRWTLGPCLDGRNRLREG